MFIENEGQFDNRARFQVRGGDRTIWLAEDGIWVSIVKRAQVERLCAEHPDVERANLEPSNLQRVNVKLSFPGANPHLRLEPFGRLGTSVNQFIGNDPAQWRTNVPLWAGVRYVDLYSGIDLELASEHGRLVPRLVARPGANLSAVRLRVEGADAVELLHSPATGEEMGVRVATAVGDFSLPFLAVELSNVQPANVQQRNAHTFDILNPFTALISQQAAVGAANVSDLLYATFLGGSYIDSGEDIAVDGSGNVYVTGRTTSSDFPAAPGAYDTTCGTDGDCNYDGSSYHSDAFVAKVNPSGSALFYATFLGGSGDEVGFSIAVDGSSNAYVTGYTRSPNFPTTPGAYDTTFNGGDGDVFVAKVNPSGSALVYATFLGGSYWDVGYNIAVDGSGNAYVTGNTSSPNFPATPGAYDTTFNVGDGDAFVAKLNPTGSALLYATFLGGIGGDWGSGIAVDGVGNAYVTGRAQSLFPATPGAYDTTFNGYSDAFVAKLNPSGSALVYATFLGGSYWDVGYDIAVDGSGNAYVTGDTSSPNFPTTSGTYDTTCGTDGNCNYDGFFYRSDTFVAKVNPSGSVLLYATFLGGSGDDWGSGIAVDGIGNAYVTGHTASSDFQATPGAYDTDFNGYSDAFVVKLSPSGSGQNDLSYATFLGGSDWDRGYGIHVDGSGNVYVTGYTASSDFPATPGAYDTSYNYRDAFVVKLALGGEAFKLYLPLVLRNFP